MLTRSRAGRLFTWISIISSILALAIAACGDDEGPDTSSLTGSGGAGGNGNGGEQIGGFMTGPGSGGMGGEVPEGGHGDLNYVWSNVHGGAGSIVTRDVAIDSAGAIIVVGAFTGGPINFGGADLTSAGGTDIFVAKFASDGSHIWSDSYGAANDQGALGVATDASNSIIIGGNFKGSFSVGTGTTGTITWIDNQFPDVYVAKLNADGGYINGAAFAIGVGQNDSGNAVATDSSDNIILGGRFQTSINFGGGAIQAAGGAGDQSLFLAKLSGGFNHLYSQGFGDNLQQQGWAVAGGPTGVMAVGGDSVGSIDFGGGNLDNSAGQRAVLAKFDGTGQHVFSFLFEGGDSRVEGVAFDGSGNLFAAGNFKTSVDLGSGPIDASGAVDDFFVAKYDASGNMLYASTFGDQARDSVKDLALDSDGYAYLVGSFADELRINSTTTLTSSASIQDAFLVAVGPTLGLGFAGIGSSGSESAEGAGVAVDPSSGQVVIVGNVTGDIDLGGGIESGVGDLFIAKYSR